MNQEEEAIKENCRNDFGACWELAGNETVSLELFLWLKENYEGLCLIQRWGQADAKTEFRWSLDDDAGYRAVYLEESLWGNPLMPEANLVDEAELADDTAVIETILMNPNCPRLVIESISNIQFEDRMWIDDVGEEEVEDLRQLAQDLLEG